MHLQQSKGDLSRRRVEDAISEMGRDEVLEAKMVLAGAWEQRELKSIKRP